MDDITIIQGDAVEVMRTLPDSSIDAIICDPPYPCIDRPYGRMTEPEWHEMMRGVVAEARRILRPHGSAVFILQPNSEEAGKVRPWLWEFMAWTCREWNMVQDVWWWNFAMLPTGASITSGLLRGSLKACVWLGVPDCYRNQDAVLWSESDKNRSERIANRCLKWKGPSGQGVDEKKCRDSAAAKGGVTPFNVLPIPGCSNNTEVGHPAATPDDLADWWTRYITRPGDTILDMFCGSGTMPLAAQARDRKAIGIERDAGYVAISRRRIEEGRLPMFDGPRPVTAPVAVPPPAPPMFAFAEEAHP